MTTYRNLNSVGSIISPIRLIIQIKLIETAELHFKCATPFKLTTKVRSTVQLKTADRACSVPTCKVAKYMYK